MGYYLVRTNCIVVGEQLEIEEYFQIDSWRRFHSHESNSDQLFDRSIKNIYTTLRGFMKMLWFL